MSIDHTHIAELVNEIGELTRNLEQDGSVLTHTRRQALIRSAEKLTIAARKPAENLYCQGTQLAQNAAIRTAIGMGVFEHIPHSGHGIGTRELSATLNVEESLLIRVMRACSCAHLFQETSSGHYIHNAFSEAFSDPANRDLFRVHYDINGRSVYELPYYLESTKYQNPSSYTDGPFQRGHHTHLGFFEWLKDDTKRSQIFNSAMRSGVTVGDGVASLGPFPFARELALATKRITDTDVLLVDIGGGRGQALEVVRTAFPDLRGRLVLQELSDVIDDARANGLHNSIEAVSSSFFDPQPIRGAYFYYFRRVFHDWSDEAAMTVLGHIRRAMDVHSRLIIVDTVVPEMNAPRSIALQDINMMSIGGMERTRSQWEHLLQKAELKITKFHSTDEATGGSLQEAIEVVLDQRDTESAAGGIIDCNGGRDSE